MYTNIIDDTVNETYTISGLALILSLINACCSVTTSSIIFFFYLLSNTSFSPPFFFNDTAPTEIYTLPLHDALPISDAERAPGKGGDVKVASRIPEQSGVGKSPVRSASEAMQHGLLARRIQLEHRALGESATIQGGAVKVALLVANQTRFGKPPVHSIEAVQHGLRTRGIHLEHRAAAAGSGACVRAATVDRGAVEVARLVPDQSGVGMCPVRPPTH